MGERNGYLERKTAMWFVGIMVTVVITLTAFAGSTHDRINKDMIELKERVAPGVGWTIQDHYTASERHDEAKHQPLEDELHEMNLKLTAIGTKLGIEFQESP